MGSSRRPSGKPSSYSRPRPGPPRGRPLASDVPLSITLRQLPGAAVLVDQEGRIVNANAAAARVVRCKRRELIGELLSTWIADWQRPSSQDDEASRARFEVECVRADNSHTTVRIARRETRIDGLERTLVFIADCERRKKLEKEIRDTAYGFHQIARVMPHMLWTCTPDGAAKYISPQWIKFTGQPLEAHLGYGWLDHLHPDDRDVTMRHWLRAIERQETFKAEFRVRAADGSYRWFDSTCLIVRNRDDSIVRWMGSNVDIHDSHEMRVALIRERDRLQKIAQMVPAAIYSYRLNASGSTQFDFASAGLKELLSFSGEEIGVLAPDQMKAVHPDDSERLRRSILESARELSPWICEWRVIHPQKGERWVEGRAVPTREVDGSTLWYGLMVDITDKKRAEEALSRSRAQLQAAVRASGIGTWILDLITNRFWFDDTLLGMLDTISEEIEYRGIETLQRFVHPEDWPAAALAVDAVRQGKTDQYYVEFRNQRRDGALQWLSLNARAERDSSGKMIRVTGACADITARKAAEETQRQSQRIEALGTLAGGIAHDFNNILLAITGNARLALAELSSAQAHRDDLHRHLVEIDRASSRATDLVRRILTFSRQSEARSETIDLRSPVEEAVKLLRASLPAMIAIETSFASDVPPVMADSTQIYQVIMNLVTNSAYAIGESAGTISVSLDKIAVVADTAPDGVKPGLYARITVSDTGRGMDHATLERIFDPFFTTKPPGQGTGLGLSVVHGIVRKHQGTITVTSTPGHGSIFALYFPAVARVEEVAPKSTSEAARGTGQCVLYVDDEEALVFLVTRVLRRLGYAVKGFTDPEEAVDAFRRDPQAFDVVVTDLSMPRMSGFRLAKLLLETRPDVPVLMTSGYVRAEDRDLALQTGIRELILKPNTIEELGHSLARLFEETRTDTHKDAKK